MRATNNAPTPIPVANTPNVAPVAPVASTTPPSTPAPPKKSLKRPGGGKIKSDKVSENGSARKKVRRPYLKKNIRFSSSDDSE